MQIQELSYNLNSLYFQHRQAIYFIFMALVIVLTLLGSHGVVHADEPITGGGTCSGC
jgi:hypothetical protein